MRSIRGTIRAAGRPRRRALTAATMVTCSFVCGLAGPWASRAQALTTITDAPITFEVGNPCNGEIVTISGTLRTVSTSRTDASGGTHFATSATGVQLAGVSAAGTRYRVIYGQRFSSSGGTVPPASQFTAPSTFSVVSNSGVDNFIVHAVVHATTNAQGEATADVFINSAECRG